MSYLSVVIATYNRCAVLEATLQHVRSQTLSPDLYEVIVVDDGSSDATADVVKKCAAQFPFPVRYLHHNNRGPGFTQNRGIREAEGSWILLIADDIHPTPSMLERHYQAHAAHPAWHEAVAGKVIQSPHLPRTHFQVLWDPFRYDAIESLDELSYINFWACNVSFKREFMMQYGMFIERSGAAHEDTEVGWRLQTAGGMRLRYCKEALAHHYHVETVDAACARAYERGRRFHILADSIDDPGLWIRFQVMPSSWRDISCAFKKSTAHVLQQDGSPSWFLIRESIRKWMLNRWWVDGVCLPLIRASNSSSWAARCVGRRMIYWAIAHYFHRGIRDYRRAVRSACVGSDGSAPLSASAADP